MKKLLTLLSLAFVVSFCTMGTTCSHQVTLAPGGAYSDAYLATADQAILNAGKAFDAYVAWVAANQPYLAANAPQALTLRDRIVAGRNQWEKDAYAARDVYYNAETAYKAALASGQSGATPPQNATVAAAISILTDLTTQINSYRAAHP